ncbi:terpene synthase family protein [Streptomyces sp. NPDC058289]|uniref:terpene synthase family protein n=1 Tax=Streptomyces sp. NPDC058289 TaxID=3346425 RepID=UPI0036E8D827
MGTQTFTIPSVRTGFRWRINPHHSTEMDADANAWAFGLFSDDPRVPAPVHADNYTTWAALCFPDVDADLLSRWCRFNALYTVIENKQEALYETSGAGSAERLWERTVTLLFRQSHADDVFVACDWGKGLPRHNLTAAMAIAEKLPEALARYFLRRIAYMAQAQYQEDLAIRSPRMGWGEYLEYRHINFAVPLFTATIPALLERSLSAEEWESTERAQLDRLTAHHCCLVNDLYSFRKEWNDRNGKKRHVQAVSVLQHIYGLGIQEALNRLVERIEETERQFVALRSRWALTPEAEEYCDRLEDISAGNLRYHQTSPRFHGGGFEGVFTGGELQVIGATGGASSRPAQVLRQAGAAAPEAIMPEPTSTAVPAGE